MRLGSGTLHRDVTKSSGITSASARTVAGRVWHLPWHQDRLARSPRTTFPDTIVVRGANVDFLVLFLMCADARVPSVVGRPGRRGIV